MNAQRSILKSDGSKEVLFNEKCFCGNRIITIEKNCPDYATCLQCLRVRRLMTFIVPAGILEIWGTYFDPYIEPLDPERYPKNDGEFND